ncbi:ornithine cyclodeaminase family protein [Cronobacter dublinensis]|uniref:ornithine cyclodeaminase family protein n=1 Tax=Cronobacter dublinensis TaxID=413497 RepID=UPI000CFB2FDC|nr:ornithine cyclodeaminase family protein [Cronobacter dublinensis]MDI6444619.1 ornithine cyclodeaminase family protein [Cronobacter dublinensis]MDK1193648.1 ornithine cyclodeaminase family protein [Cronobacter dublinensis]MDK1200171.1 ornithine cyclodeaminase family protein [Cronobacter dublinensis]
MRFLSGPQVASLGGLDPHAALRDVTDTVRLIAAGDALMPAETHVPLDTPPGKVYALPARVGGRFNATGVKWTAHRPQPQDGLPMALTVTLINRADSGLPVGLVESGGLTAVRTAAVSALALRHAAPRPVKRVLLLGAGVQARAHLAMLSAQFPSLEALGLWNRTAERLDALSAAALPFACERYRHPGDAQAQPWDAVITCTGAQQPFLGPDWFTPGRLVMQIGYHEVSFAAIKRATQVVVDAWGEFRHTSAKSLFQMYRAGEFPDDGWAADLTALVSGRWRPAPDDCVYFSSFGLNVFDIALAARVLQAAERDEVGTPLALFGAP